MGWWYMRKEKSICKLSAPGLNFTWLTVTVGSFDNEWIRYENCWDERESELYNTANTFQIAMGQGMKIKHKNIIFRNLSWHYLAEKKKKKWRLPLEYRSWQRDHSEEKSFEWINARLSTNFGTSSLPSQVNKPGKGLLCLIVHYFEFYVYSTIENSFSIQSVELFRNKQSISHSNICIASTCNFIFFLMRHLFFRNWVYPQCV